MTLEKQYEQRYSNVLTPLAANLQAAVADYLAAQKRIDRVSARAKSIKSFLQKAGNVQEDGSAKYARPLEQIQDQIGVRVTTFYLDDVDPISRVLLEYLRPIEAKDIVPSSEWEFGYFGRHYVCFFPHELVDDSWATEEVPQFFELQIKTLFQHAWSEAEHDLGYKPDSGRLNADQKRMLAYTSAQAWGADRIFNDLFRGVEAKK